MDRVRGNRDDVEQARAPLDDLARDLQRRRVDAGGVSYAEIAVRIGRLRQERGLSPEQARVARSSVFDAFREGRSRVNADLVADIARALGDDDESAERWRRRVLEAQHGGRDAAPGAERGAEAPVDVDPRPRRALVGALAAGAVFLNLFAGVTAQRFELPVFLDMIGTATVSIVLGPWYGVAVGIVTNLLGTLTTSPETLLFALVNAAGALVWGYGVRRVAGRRPYLRFAAVSLCAGLACALVALPVNALLYGWPPDGDTAALSALFVSAGVGRDAALLSAEVSASLLDKMLAGFVGLVIAAALAPARLWTDATDPLAPFRGRSD